MPLIQISKQYLVFQNEDSITVDIPESILLDWQKNYTKISKAKGILKHKKVEMLSYLDALRHEWER